MELKQLFKEDDAVSPVIGVILMVAITVILAAVIGAFVLNLGGASSSAPQAKYDWKWDVKKTGSCAKKCQDKLVHEGGDKLDAKPLSIQGESNMSLQSGPFSAGDTIAKGVADPGDTLKLVWNSPDSDKTQILSEKEHPPY